MPLFVNVSTDRSLTLGQFKLFLDHDNLLCLARPSMTRIEDSALILKLLIHRITELSRSRWYSQRYTELKIDWKDSTVIMKDQASLQE